MKTVSKLVVSVVFISSVVALAHPVQAQDALDKMATVFEGDYSRSVIKRHMDKAMRLYDLPITERYYEKAGSVLVTLSNENEGVTEMEILVCTIEAHTPGVGIKYHEMAALCATRLSSD